MRSSIHFSQKRGQNPLLLFVEHFIAWQRGIKQSNLLLVTTTSRISFESWLFFAENQHNCIFWRSKETGCNPTIPAGQSFYGSFTEYLITKVSVLLWTKVTLLAHWPELFWGIGLVYRTSKSISAQHWP